MSESLSPQEGVDESGFPVAPAVRRLVVLAPRWLYLTTFCWISVVGGRFAASFLQDTCGLTVTAVGIALALQTATAALLSGLGGAVADAQERSWPGRGRATCMALGTVVGTLAYLGHSVVPAASESVNATTSVFLHVLLRCLFAASTVFVFPVLDGLTLDHLANQENANNNHGSSTDVSDYGKERLYGAIGWAFTNVAMGFLLDRYGFVSTYPLAVLTAVMLWVTLAIYVYVPLEQAATSRQLLKHKSDIHSTDDDKDERQEQEAESLINSKQEASSRKEAQEEKSLYSLIWLLINHSYGVVFFLAVVALSSGQSVVDSLIFLFFGNDLGSSYTTMGWTVVLTVAFEIPIFQVAPTLLRRWGAGRLLLVAAVCYVVRVAGYTLIPEGHVVYVLLLEPLHGVTYACSQTAVVDHVANLMPDSYEATGQGLVYVSRGLGSVLGLWLGGWAEDNLGARAMYRLSALVVLIGTVGLAIKLWQSRGQQSLDGRHVQGVELTTRDAEDENDAKM